MHGWFVGRVGMSGRLMRPVDFWQLLRRGFRLRFPLVACDVRILLEGLTPAEDENQQAPRPSESTSIHDNGLVSDRSIRNGGLLARPR
jgi:hypothetical protein